MSITLDLAPEIEAALREKAHREGRDAASVAGALVAEALTWEVQDRAEAIEGIRRGLEASAEGRVTPLSDVIAEARRRHGFPDSWPSNTDV
jgi:predicted transcriptional regulator